MLARHGGRVNIRDGSGKTPRDCVREGCSGNQDIIRMVQLAYDVEERKRLEVSDRIPKNARSTCNVGIDGKG